MSNEHREAIAKQAGWDIYANNDMLQENAAKATNDLYKLQQGYNGLQAQVSELKENLAYCEKTLDDTRAERDDVFLSKKKLTNAYALLKAAIDKKAIVRSKASFVSQVKEAYVEAEKILGVK